MPTQLPPCPLPCHYSLCPPAPPCSSLASSLPSPPCQSHRVLVCCAALCLYLLLNPQPLSLLARCSLLLQGHQLAIALTLQLVLRLLPLAGEFVVVLGQLRLPLRVLLHGAALLLPPYVLLLLGDREWGNRGGVG